MARFANKIMTLANPLPAVTWGDLYKRAGVVLRKTRQKDRPVFDLELRWGGGCDLETRTLLPGDSIEVPEEDAKEVLEDFKAVGGGICGTNPGLAAYGRTQDRLTAMIEALHIAEQHYHTIGAGQIDGVRASRGHSDADLERYKDSVYASYRLAMAKEALIREQRELLQMDAETAPKRKAG